MTESVVHHDSCREVLPLELVCNTSLDIRTDITDEHHILNVDLTVIVTILEDSVSRDLCSTVSRYVVRCKSCLLICLVNTKIVVSPSSAESFTLSETADLDLSTCHRIVNIVTTCSVLVLTVLRKINYDCSVP